MRVGADAFDLEPLSPDNQCSPQSVSAHMLYENSDPFRLIEPGGILEVEDACYRQLDNGSRLVRTAWIDLTRRPAGAAARG